MNKQSQQFPKEIPKEALTSGPSEAMINIAYVPRATANDRGSWSLSRVVDTAGIGRGVPRLLNPQHPQSNAPMWIHPLSEKSFAVLAALFLSLFVFVFAAGEAGAEEQVVLPMDPWCAMPPGTAPTDTVPPGAAPCPPTVLPPSAVDDSVSLPARGTEPTPWQQQQVLPSPGADDIGGPRPEPIRPHLSPPTEMPTDKPGAPKKFTPEEALPKPGSGANPVPPATEDFVAPSSANEPKLASPALQKDGPAGLQPSSAPDDNKLPAANSVPTSPGSSVESTGEQAPTASDRTSDPIPSQVQASEAEDSTMREVVEPLVQQALTQTHTTISETVAT